MTAAVLETGRQRVNQVFDEIVEFAGIQVFLDSPVRAYSTGMRARLGFSIAMHLAPDILLVDEVLAVGDIGFQRQCIRYARRYLEDGGSLVLVSHNPHLVQFICDRCIVLDHGNVVIDGSVVDGVAKYMQATRTATGDPLALDAALAGASPGFKSPCEGSGVEIDDFGVEPAGSAPIGTGAPVRVYVRYRTCRALDVRWGFCLTPDLATTIACEGLLNPFPIQAGAGELTGTVPRLPLSAGRYALRVAIMDPHTELPLALGGFYTPPRYFTIETPASIRDNYRMFTGDLVALEDLKWELRS